MQDSLGHRSRASARAARARLQRLDWLLLLAAVGLIAFSVYTIGTATENDIEGSPHYYVIRQAVYGVVGIVLMLLVARFDYSRMREWRAGLYVLMIGSILLVFAFGGVARGSKRAIELPFFSFQASELGKVLLILALSGLRGRPGAQAGRGRDHEPGDAARARPRDARDRPAGPRLRPRLHRDRDRGAVRGRHQVDPLRRPRARWPRWRS